MFHRRLNVFGFRTLRNRHRSRELAAPTFLHDIAILLFLFREVGFPGNDKPVVLEIDGNILLRQAGKLEGSGYEVVLRRLVDVNPRKSSVCCIY